MPRRKISFDVEVNTPSAQREADRVAAIFQGKLKNIAVGTKAGGTGGGSGGGSGSGGGNKGLTSGMPGSSLSNLIFGSAQFAFAGFFYKFFSDLPSNIMQMDKLATANKRAYAAFTTLAGGAKNANDMIKAYTQGSGNVATRTEAVTEAMRLQNVGIAKNADQMRKITTISRGMSQATGKDVGYIEEQFSLAMANQSLLRFDQLGLSIERHKQIMADLRKEYPEMSREVAFQNAMLQQATEKYYNLATAQEALATSTEIANRQLKNGSDILAEIFSQNVAQPIASSVSELLGAQDPNAGMGLLMAHRASEERKLKELQANGGLSGIEPLMATAFSNQRSPGWVAQGQANIAAQQRKLNAFDSLAQAEQHGAAAANLGVEVPKQWVDTIREMEDALNSGQPVTQEMTAKIYYLNQAITLATDALTGQGDATTDLGDKSMAAQQQIEDLAGSLEGVAVGLVGKLIDAGASADQVRKLLPSQDDIDTRAKQIVDQGDMAGDVISDEIAAKMAEKELFGDADSYLQSVKDAASANKKASSAAEAAAKAWDKTVNDTADKLKQTFDDMLHKIPGIFGTSEVTEDDLLMAKKGQPVEFADNALRRLNDVAFNKKKRDDVNLDDWAQALHMPAGTDPQVLAIMAKRQWESGELWANPENISKFMNVDAAKSGLHGQEMAALGGQNLEAFFGMGSEQGNEFLKVFGVKILDPIHDGLISEVTTKGPIMGKVIADAMYDGFRSQAMQLPWVDELMKIVIGQTGRTQAAEDNSNATSDTATSDTVYTGVSDRLR